SLRNRTSWPRPGMTTADVNPVEAPPSVTSSNVAVIRLADGLTTANPLCQLSLELSTNRLKVKPTACAGKPVLREIAMATGVALPAAGLTLIHPSAAPDISTAVELRLAML